MDIEETTLGDLESNPVQLVGFHEKGQTEQAALRSRDKYLSHK